MQVCGDNNGDGGDGCGGGQIAINDCKMTADFLHLSCLCLFDRRREWNRRIKRMIHPIEILSQDV